MKKCTETGSSSEKKLFRRILLVLLALVLVCCVSVGISICICSRCLAVHEYALQINGVSKPFTAVLLSDLHGKEYGEQNKELLDRICGQKPDVIFCVGDMIDGSADSAEVERFLELLVRLREIAPVYASYGNHEQQYMNANKRDLTPLIEETGVTLLDESCVTADVAGNTLCIGGTLGHLYPFGRSLKAYHSSPEYRLMSQMQSSGLPAIVLSHLPDTIIFNRAYEDWDIDLFLSGHTHGGIVRIPFLGGLYAPMQGWFPDEDMGYFDYGRVQLVITSGLAGHGKIPRIFNRPEVCVLHILPAE